MDRRATAAAAGCLGWIVAFAATAIVPLPRFWYLPLERRWAFQAAVQVQEH